MSGLSVVTEYRAGQRGCLSMEMIGGLLPLCDTHAMALDQSALIELLEMMRSADENDLMRRLLGDDVAGACGRGGERVHRRGAP